MVRIGIRVDANKMVATGHVMRCLAISEELKKMGVNPLFISADDYPKHMIVQRGYEFVALQSDWKHMEGEIDKLQLVIKKYNIRILLVDSYYVTILYLEKLHAFTRVIYIDDLGKETYDIDAVVCYANYYKEFALKERYSSKVKLLQGTDYTPLRNTFSNLPPKKMSVDVKELIVLSGGTDTYDFLWNFSERILKAPLFEKLETIHIICGTYYDKYESLTQKFSKINKFNFYKAVDNIEKFMLSADIAISAAGVTSYELCAVGTPTITYIIADNQKKNAESFQIEGIMECAGDLRYDPVLEKIIELLEGKYQEIQYRKRTSEAMRKKVDGKGAQRIAQELSVRLLGEDGGKYNLV